MATRYNAHDSEATVSWTSGGPNSLADGSTTSLSDALSNDAATTERELFANFRYTLAATSSRSAGAYIELFVVPEVGGTYGSIDGDCKYGHTNARKPVDSSATAAREIIFEKISLPNADFKVAIRNKVGVAFGASGNTLKYEAYTVEEV